VTVRVLVVEDDDLAAEAHATYTGRMPGFDVAGVVHSAGEALRFLAADPEVDLLLLDMHLPDGHGLGLLRRIRATGHRCDVIAVTSARDSDVVRRAVSQGVVLYLLKPFSFSGFRTKLEQYAAYRERLADTAHDVVQDDVDQLFGVLRSRAGDTDLPKGMSADSMRQVTSVLREASGPLSASEVAESLGASRVTARRYLEHLADQGLVGRSPRYGGTGRPEVAYAWNA
jgi:response regulator of citrate/malate metabolism